MKLPQTIDEFIEQAEGDDDLTDDMRRNCEDGGIREEDFEDEDKFLAKCKEVYINERGEYFDETANQIESVALGDTIFRAMEVNYPEFVEKVKKGVQPAGLFWAWDEEKAIVYGHEQAKGKRNVVILHGHVTNPEHIDVEGTLSTNIRYMNEEREIRLLPEGEVEITKVCHEVGSKKTCIDLNVKLPISDVRD